MEEILDKCCGLDVHRDTIVACVMIGNGPQKRKQIKTFFTFTEDIEELAVWLKSLDVRDVAVESTGIYWKPIFNVFDEGFFNVRLVNAQHVKNVPGRKSDVKDSEWLCRLLKCGMLSSSFIPPKSIAHLRELVRLRQSLVRDLSTAKNRIIKSLENANIKLSSVFSDVFGVTGWGIICKMVKGETNLDSLTANIDPRVRASRSDIKKALKGTLKKNDLELLKILMKEVNDREASIALVEKQIKNHIVPYHAEIALLTTIPGIEWISATGILAEIGANMNQFRDASHVTSWAGMCPGSYKSGGKILSTRTRKGNRYLKVLLNQVAWAISRTKKTYLGAKYRALAYRKGKKKAIVAIGRKALEIIYHMLKSKVPFQGSWEELGAESEKAANSLIF